jgi:signal transduction histidine kinase
MRRLVDDLMDLSRIGAGKVELRREKVAIQQILQRAAESVQPQARDHGHVLEIFLPGQPIFLKADPARLEQVFVNLLNNAIKYTQRGGHIWLKCTGEDEEVVMRVEDDGVGIPQDMLPRIFDLFTQVDSTRKQAEGGLGIGLALVKKLVSLHGGSVQVNSEGPGRGSEFTVRLPLRAEKEIPDQDQPSSGGLRSSVSIGDPATEQRH